MLTTLLSGRAKTAVGDGREIRVVVNSPRHELLRRRHINAVASFRPPVAGSLTLRFVAFEQRFVEQERNKFRARKD